MFSVPPVFTINNSGREGLEAAAGLCVIWRAQWEYKEFKYHSFSFPLLLFTPPSPCHSAWETVSHSEPWTMTPYLSQPVSKNPLAKQTWTPASSALLEVTFCAVGCWDSWITGLHCTQSTFNQLSETLADRCLGSLCTSTFVLTPFQFSQWTRGTSLESSSFLIKMSFLETQLCSRDASLKGAAWPGCSSGDWYNFTSLMIIPNKSHCYFQLWCRCPLHTYKSSGQGEN